MPLTEEFTITYTSNLYHGRRHPSMLFEALPQLISEEKVHSEFVDVRFYSPKEQWLLSDIEKYNLTKVVRLCGYIPKEKVLKVQMESPLLLLIRWDSRKKQANCPAKIFEYIGSGRPIIALGGCSGIINDLLENIHTQVNSRTIRKWQSIFFLNITRITSIRAALRAEPTTMSKSMNTGCLLKSMGKSWIGL